MPDTERLTPEQAYTKIFDTFNATKEYSKAGYLSWHFFNDSYPDRVYPVGEDGMGVELPLGYSISESEFRALNIAKGRDGKGETVDFMVWDYGYDKPRLRIHKLVPEPDLITLTEFFQDVRQKWQEWSSRLSRIE